MKGDRVEIVIDAGGEGTRTYEVVAARAGRRVEVATRRGVVEVSEVKDTAWRTSFTTDGTLGHMALVAFNRLTF